MPEPSAPEVEQKAPTLSTRIDTNTVSRKTPSGLRFRGPKTRRELMRDVNQLNELAIEDGVTGLLNRRAFDEAAKNYKAQIDRKVVPGELRETFGIAFLDIDNFKPFNDKFGHAVGDSVLKLTANAWKDSLRESDILGRYGGDEMVGVLTNIDEYFWAPDVADNIQNRVKEHIKTHMPADLKETLTGVDINVTVGVGYSDALHGSELQDVIKAADQMMLYRKPKEQVND